MHTPGPWTCQPIGDETECNILGSRRELVAVVADSDARLIAAAPALLEALEEIIAQADGKGGVFVDALNAGRAAIAQARGETANG